MKKDYYEGLRRLFLSFKRCKAILIHSVYTSVFSVPSVPKHLFFLVVLLTIVLPGCPLRDPPERKDGKFRGGRGMMMDPMHSPMMDWASRLNLGRADG